LIREKPEKLHVVLTGRNAHAALIEMADLVTEMRDVKHPYANGTPAQKGIDF
jgi:cob(I)alamin adenosyltransferase